MPRRRLMTGDVIRRQTAALAAATTVGAGSGGNRTLPIDDGARAGLVASMSLHDVRGVHFPALTQLGLELLRRSVRLAAPGGQIKTESWNRRWPLRANVGRLDRGREGLLGVDTGRLNRPWATYARPTPPPPQAEPPFRRRPARLSPPAASGVGTHARPWTEQGPVRPLVRPGSRSPPVWRAPDAGSRRPGSHYRPRDWRCRVATGRPVSYTHLDVYKRQVHPDRRRGQPFQRRHRP